LSKTLRGALEDQDLDDNYDNMVKPQEGQSRVYAVPRVRKCISSLFIKLMNYFGNAGGFDLVLSILKKEEGEVGAIDLNILGMLVANLSTPYQIYHKEFISEYGP
jgi:hypothetical protein